MQKTMYRVNKDKNNPYVILNKTFLNDTNISWQAKGLLSYLLSLPDDWKIYESEIQKHGKDGIKCTRACVKELIETGYIARNRLKDEKGRFAGYEYLVYEISIMPKSANGETENGKGHTTNNNLTDNDLTKYKKDDGISPSGESSPTLSTQNQDVVEAIRIYMNDLYRQRTKKKHPFLKPEQYHAVYESLASFCNEWGTDRQALVDMMCQFLNTKTIQSDWNINHFATEGIMLNRMYEVAY